jgi:xylulokinase
LRFFDYETEVMAYILLVLHIALNVLNPGEIAATAGTSGIVYDISDKRNYDTKSRVNSFAQVNYSPEKRVMGIEPT